MDRIILLRDYNWLKCLVYDFYQESYKANINRVGGKLKEAMKGFAHVFYSSGLIWI